MNYKERHRTENMAPQPEGAFALVTCSHCQSSVPEDATFCGYCGNRLTAEGDKSLAVEEDAYSEPETEWMPLDEEALHQITIAVAKLLAGGAGKEEIVRGLVCLNGWPEDSAVGFVNGIQLEIRTGRRPSRQLAQGGSKMATRSQRSNRDGGDDRPIGINAAEKASIIPISRLPTIGGQPVWPVRFFVAAGLGIAMGILAAWWLGPVVFLGAYFGLAAIDLRIQRWKLAHYQETGLWIGERKSDIPQDQQHLRDVDRAAREFGMQPKEFARATRHFMNLVDHVVREQDAEEAASNDE